MWSILLEEGGALHAKLAFKFQVACPSCAEVRSGIIPHRLHTDWTDADIRQLVVTRRGLMQDKLGGRDVQSSTMPKRRQTHITGKFADALEYRGPAVGNQILVST